MPGWGGRKGSGGKLTDSLKIQGRRSAQIKGEKREQKPEESTTRLEASERNPKISSYLGTPDPHTFRDHFLTHN